MSTPVTSEQANQRSPAETAAYEAVRRCRLDGDDSDLAIAAAVLKALTPWLRNDQE